MSIPTALARWSAAAPEECRRAPTAGRYEARMNGDGSAEVRVKRFDLSPTMESSRSADAWRLPMAGYAESAGIRLDPGEYEMDAVSIPPEEQFQPII